MTCFFRSFSFFFSDFHLFSLFYFTFFLLFAKPFSFSCANSTCACGQTGNHSDSGLIDNQKLIKYRTPIISHNVRSMKDSVALFNEHKSHATRMKNVIANIEPIYVNRMQNQSVNYNINNNINRIQNGSDYFNATGSDDVTKTESIINVSKTKSNYKLMGKPPSGEKYLRSFYGFSLDEREMPITRERSKLLQASNTKRCVGDAKKPPKLIGSPKLLRASTCDAYPSRAKNRYVYIYCMANILHFEDKQFCLPVATVFIIIIQLILCVLANKLLS